MIDEKNRGAPPAYPSPQGPPPVQHQYTGQQQQYPQQQYPPQPYPSPGHPLPGQVMSPPMAHGSPGYFPQPPPDMSLGAQYQQTLMGMCAQGNHDYTSKYGVLGIILAVICFPIGLIALCIDREERCVRCGARR